MDKKILKASYFKDRVFREALAKIKSAKRIIVWGDEDPDGMTATIVLSGTLRKLGKETDYFIPSRNADGVGLNKKRIKQILKKQYDMLITVDCGTVNIDEQQLLRNNNVEVIITDHHIPYRLPSDDVLLINTHTLKSPYFRDLSGSGVALILSVYLKKHMKKLHTYDRALYSLGSNIGIAALGMLCDKVKISGFNRYLKEYYNKNGKRVEHIGHMIGSDVNMCGLFYQSKTVRMKNPIVDIFLSNSVNGANRACLDSMARNCKKQQQYMEKIFVRETAKVNMNDSMILHYNPRLDPAFAGLLAGYICRASRKPVLVMTKKGKEMVGEARSINLNWMNVFKAYSKYFKTWGGHNNAAGFSMDRRDFKPFLNSISIKYNSTDIY